MNDAQNSTDQHALAVETPRRVVGRPFPKGVSGNASGRPKGHKAVLRDLIGEHGERGYRLIWQIAQGELSFEKLAREPGPGEDVSSAALIPLVRVVPTIRERKDAAEFLIEQLNGKATAHLDVTAKVENETRLDLSRLSDSQLETFEVLLERASEDADFVDVDACPGMLPALPASTQTAQLVQPMPPVVESEPAQLVRPVTDADASGSDYTWSETT